MSTEPAWYVAIYDFAAENDNELSFQEGDYIQVYNKGTEWWEGTTQDGRCGLFPANRVAEYTAENTTTTDGNYNSTIASAYQYQERSNPPTVSVAKSRSNMSGLEKKVSADEVRVGVKTPPAGASPAADATRGGGDAKKGESKEREAAPRTSKTKFGLWASNMAYMSAFTSVFLAIGALDWGAENKRWGILYVGIGIYTLLISVLVCLYEYYYGESRGGSRFPFRGVAYLIISGPMFITYPTVFGGVLFFVAAVANGVSAYLGEEYEPPKSEQSQEKPAPTIKGDTFIDRAQNWVLVKKQQNRFGLVVFVSMYFIANLVVFFHALAEWIDINKGFDPSERLSSFGPWAKAFGNLLDLNCAIIVVPVLRSIIRWLYNRSTADEGCFARSLRALLEFVPLDKNLIFHKLIAKVIVFGAVGHTLMHLFNYARAPGPSLDRFGVWPWISGGIICVLMLLMYGSAADNVKRGQFEMFWYSHHGFVGFFAFLLLHGAKGWNPNFWKWFLLPGTLYFIERMLRVYRAKQDVVLLSVTNMKPNVFSLEFAKQGVFSSPYKEGQYIFLKCPTLSEIQWHPFTISSAPQEKTVTVHIKKQGHGSWTSELYNYLSAMGPANATYFELTRQSEQGLIPGKIQGPNGLPLLEIDGPHSAPTQHISEYNTVIVAGAGIGVTPVASTLKSVVLHRWKFFLGHCFPDNAYFFWVCAHNDIDSFRWLIRNIKDCQDEIYDMRAKNAKDMNQKRFEFHIFVTSVPKGQQPIDVVVDDDIGFWGRPREDRHIDKIRAPFTELDLYKTLKCPSGHTVLGDVQVWEGRPKWDERFLSVVGAHPKGDIGVAFCGNPFVGKDLKEMCFKHSSLEQERIFKLHKENF